MKTNPNSTVTARVQALSLVAAILSPGMVLASPASSNLIDIQKSAVGKTSAAPKAGIPNRSEPPPVRFNMVDGQPIR